MQRISLDRAPFGLRGRSGRIVLSLIAAASMVTSWEALAEAPGEPGCSPGFVRAAGRPDPSLFAATADRGIRAGSAATADRGIRAEWCERYDERGKSHRVGVYLERYPSGALRAKAHYVDSQLAGPVVAYLEDGPVFLRAFLEAGEWKGPFALYHETGVPLFEATFEAGRLHGSVRTRHADGSLASETTFQHGREDGLARSFYPLSHGARLRSEVRIEADLFAGPHRVFDAMGNPLARSADEDPPPVASVRPDIEPSGIRDRPD